MGCNCCWHVYLAETLAKPCLNPGKLKPPLRRTHGVCSPWAALSPLVRVPTLHLTQHIVVPALEGNMEELTQLGELSARTH